MLVGLKNVLRCVFLKTLDHMKLSFHMNFSRKMNTKYMKYSQKILALRAPIS